MVLDLKFVTLLLSVILLKLLIPANSQATTTIGEKVYYVGMTAKVNWYSANHICTAIGMSLTSIESETEWQNLKNFLNLNSISSKSYWLSGSDLAEQSNFSWLSSGNKFSYTKWAASQPSASGKMCVNTDTDFKWLTSACDTGSNYFICSKPVIPDCGVNGRCSYRYY